MNLIVSESDPTATLDSHHESDAAMFKFLTITQRRGFTLDRAAGGDRDHRHPDRSAAAGGAERRGRRPAGLSARTISSNSAWPPPIIMTSIGICRPASATIRPPVTACLAPAFSTCCRISSKATSIDRSLGSVPFPPPDGPTMVHYPGNNNVYSQPVPIFLCPSDPSVESGRRRDGRWDYLGASCYAGNALVSAQYDLTVSPPTSNPQGKVRIPADFADGTSNTILHAEKYARCTNTDMAPPFRDGGNAWAFCTSAVFPWLPPPMSFPGKALLPGFAIPALASRGAPM